MWGALCLVQCYFFSHLLPTGHTGHSSKPTNTTIFFLFFSVALGRLLVSMIPKDFSHLPCLVQTNQTFVSSILSRHENSIGTQLQHCGLPKKWSSSNTPNSWPDMDTLACMHAKKGCIWKSVQCELLNHRKILMSKKYTHFMHFSKWLKHQNSPRMVCEWTVRFIFLCLHSVLFFFSVTLYHL